MVDGPKNKNFIVLEYFEKEEPRYGLRNEFINEASKHFSVISHQEVLANVELAEKVVGAFVTPRNIRWLNENLDALYKKVRVVCTHSVGLDHINLELYRNKGIRVGYTPDVVCDATADCALMLMLSSARNFKEAVREAIGPRPYQGFNQNFLGVDVCFATLGIVGMGGIGLNIAKRAHGFDMSIHYHNRNRRPQEENLYGAKYHSSLHEMIPICDFIVLSCPLTKETTKLFSKKEFDLMKRTATIVNVARGPVIDTQALVEALENKSIRAAALDVTDPEPLPHDHPLLKMDSVIVFPHHGTATHQTRTRMENLLINNMIAGLNGEEMPAEYKF